jgi:hypothetical protein
MIELIRIHALIGGRMLVVIARAADYVRFVALRHAEAIASEATARMNARSRQ